MKKPCGHNPTSLWAYHFPKTANLNMGRTKVQCSTSIAARLTASAIVTSLLEIEILIIPLPVPEWRSENSVSSRSFQPSIAHLQAPAVYIIMYMYL